MEAIYLLDGPMIEHGLQGTDYMCLIYRDIVDYLTSVLGS